MTSRLPVLGGVTGFGWLGAWDGSPRDESELMHIGEEAAAVAWCQARYGNDGSRLVEAGLGELVPADQVVSRGPSTCARPAITPAPKSPPAAVAPRLPAIVGVCGGVSAGSPAG
jgi:hypothetical protein